MTLTPPDLGFNAALFPEYRAHQLDIAMALTEHKRFSLLSAPTGAGKSLIYLTAAKLLGARTLILTGTKGLQEQLMSDFSDAGMVDIRGQSNYRCVALDRSLRDFGKRGGGCDEGPCHAGVYCALRHEGGCHYYDAQDAARHAQIVVTNYAYWMTLGRYSDPHAIGEFDLLVLDEAHTAPDHLSSFCAVSFDSEKVNALLGLRLPAVSEGLPVWVDWARSSLTVAIRRTKEAQDDIKKAQGSARGLAVHRVLSLTDIARGLERLAGAGRWLNADAATRDAHMPGADTDWVAEAFKTKHSSGIRFTPVWAHAYAEPVIFRGIPKIVLVSATLTRDVAKYLGIAPGEMDYREVRSSFDPRRRPLIYVPTVRVDRSMNEGAKRLWMNRIDKVISTRLDRKGIIHGVSYERCREIVARSKWADYMMTHDTYSLRDVVAAFKDAEPPAILVSPSVGEGFDFPLDECRYQILAKVPFIDGRSPVIKARMQSDKGYGNHIAAMALIQQVGRGVRSSRDFSESFIFDDHFLWFRRQASFPKWFKDSWRILDTVPPAPPLDEG